jgi:hypothetical protein
MIFIGFDTAECCDSKPEPGENSLETGFINHGSASIPTGVAWYDTSKGESYGDGRRYAHEETPFMTKIPSKHDRNRGE